MLSLAPTCRWLMANRVQCFVFPCRDCGVPILIPQDDFARFVPRQWESPTDDCAVILACERCKRANIYSPLRGSPYFRVREHRECFRTGPTDRVCTLRCAGASNEFQAPLVVMWVGEPSEADKQARCESWIGGHLRCAGGHEIPWPRLQFSANHPAGLNFAQEQNASHSPESNGRSSPKRDHSGS